MRGDTQVARETEGQIKGLGGVISRRDSTRRRAACGSKGNCLKWAELIINKKRYKGRGDNNSFLGQEKGIGKH